MNDNIEIKLNLLENSHGYINEAVAYAISAKNDARKWQFAVLNLVQGLELSLKALLFKIHPILIFDNIDKVNKIDSSPKTVVPLQALDRLINPSIGNIPFSKEDRLKIRKAIYLRNQMTHSEFILKPEYATAKFFEVFAFIIHFQSSYLGNEIETIISKEALNKILDIKKGIEELVEKAKQRIKEENIESEFIILCPNCENDTFVIKNDINTCYTCRCKEQLVECKKCGKFYFEWELVNFFNEIDTDYCEGKTIIHNDFGYDYYQACSECIDEIIEDIEQQRVDDYNWEMELAYRNNRPLC